MQQIVTLGYHCNISFVMQTSKLKKETGLFEWFESVNLKSITNIINTIKNGINPNIIKMGKEKGVYILNKNVYSFHYTIDEYKEIFLRRAKRLLDLINGTNEIFFIRINKPNRYCTEEEINNFCSAIKSVNNNLTIKFLLINILETKNIKIKLDKNKITNDCQFMEKYFLFDDCKEDLLLRNNIKISNIFRNFLTEFGYNDVESTNNDKVFTDMD